MSSHFEVVRSSAPEPWHARRVVNGEITWTTEQYSRKVAAERAIVGLVHDVLAAAWFETLTVTLDWTDGERTEKALYVDGRLLPREVRYVDERES